MKSINTLILIFLSLSLLFSCKTSGYITDKESIERQKEMRKYRTGVNFADVGLMIASSVGTVLTGVSVYTEPRAKSFRKLKLVSETKDTLYINMVTDLLWKDSVYCDIRDIVLPPFRSARVIVPLNAAYNIFFRTDYNAPDDEKTEINTDKVRRVKLNPEATKPDSLVNKQ